MKKISILFVALIGLFSASCDEDFETVNQDPNNPTVVPSHLLLGNIIRINQNVIYGMQQGGDMGMCWSQQVSKVQYNDEERYIPRRAAIDGIWSTLYASVISDAKSMYSLAEAEGNTNIMGISLVLQANAYQILTDLYGPIPYTESCNITILKPAYDSQEVVYNGILNLLTLADAKLANGSGSVPASSDLIYGGDTSKWRKLANSLKLKALMRISKVRNVGPAVQALVTAGNLMSSNSDSAQLTYLAAQPDANPIYETVVFGARFEYKVSSVMINMLQSTNDPRLAVYAKKNTAATPVYAGNIPGQENPGSYGAFSSLGTLYQSATLPGVILSYAQVQLLLAEAVVNTYITGNATTYLKNGIQASFDFNGTSSPTYISQIESTFGTIPTPALKKEVIGKQTWLALYGQGFEAWTEWRRTGYPALSPVVNAAETSVPKRLYYPSTEIALNKASYTAATATITGGDTLTAPLWWMN